jgi:hypothetical protein
VVVLLEVYCLLLESNPDEECFDILVDHRQNPQTPVLLAMGSSEALGNYLRDRLQQKCMLVLIN